MKHTFTIIVLVLALILALGTPVFASNDIGSFGYRTEQLFWGTNYRLQLNNSYDNMIFFQGDSDPDTGVGIPSTAYGGYTTQYNPDTQEYGTNPQQPLTYGQLTRRPTYEGQNIAFGIRQLYIRTIQSYPLITLDKSYVGQSLLIPITLVYEIIGNEFQFDIMQNANPYLLLYTSAQLDTNVGATPIYFDRSASTYSANIGQRLYVDMVFEYKITEPQTIYGIYLQYNAPITFKLASTPTETGVLEIHLIMPQYSEVHSFLTLDQQKWVDQYETIRDANSFDAYEGLRALADAFNSAPNSALLTSTSYGTTGATLIINAFFGFAPLNFLLVTSVVLALLAFTTRVVVSFGSSLSKSNKSDYKVKSNKSDYKRKDK